jgi:ubiquinone/menaquinone biosynthesis C-methylase UbiE
MGVDYDDRLHRVYAEGRRLSADSLRSWRSEFERYAPSHRPLTVLDLGSGTGRFTPLLAEAFGGPVYGVEPSARMREIAESGAAHPAVRYLHGRAEAIPLPDESCDLALLFLTLHHFTDQPAALAELVRVLRPAGVVLIRSQFSDRMPDLFWYRYLPSARRVDAAMYKPLGEVVALARAAGLEGEPVRVRISGQPRTLRETYERLVLRPFSTFEHLADDEVEAGLAEMARDAETDPDRPMPAFAEDLLVLRKSGTQWSGQSLV